MTCSVCCDSFTSLTRSEIICPRQECNFSCCKSCLKTYFTISTNNPHCMNCKYEFEDMFIIEQINYTFFKTELKKKQMELLLQIEQSRIPQTQEQAKQVLYNEQRRERITQVAEQKKILYHKYNIERMELKNHLYTDVNYSWVPLLAELFLLMLVYPYIWYFIICVSVSFLKATAYAIVLYHKYNLMMELNHQLSADIQALEDTIPPSITPSRQKTEIKFIMKCQLDGCKGFLSTSYKCELCEHQTCSKCYEVVYHEHTCDKEKVETVTMIKRETRSCPVCSTRISKIEGCDQMWCTHCNNAFSWKTGRVQTGAIHNPHYFDYLKKQNGYQPRNPLDIPCGGIPNLPILLLHSRRWRPNVEHVERNIAHIQRFCLHLQNTREPFPLNRRLEELRIQYILNRLPLEKWKEKIYAQHLVDKRKTFEWDMSEIIINVGGDLLRNYDHFMSETKRTLEECTDYVMNKLVKEFSEIITYVNDLKMKKTKTYKQKANIIVMEQSNHITNYSEKYVDPL